MNPKRAVNILLDDLPGVDQATLDQIMEVVYGVVDRVKTGNPQADCQEFERQANPLLVPYGVHFDAHDETLLRYGMPARAGLDGVVVLTPQRINRREFDNVREILSHELVHSDQMSRAVHGNALKMYQSSHDRMMPGGQFDRQAYATDRHEVTAHARSAIDRMRRKKMSRDQALDLLRTGSPSHLKYVDPKSHRRFLKHAAGYAEQLPEHCGHCPEDQPGDLTKAKCHKCGGPGILVGRLGAIVRFQCDECGYLFNEPFEANHD